jgi:SAM-dependent methyltransferase
VKLAVTTPLGPAPAHEAAARAAAERHRLPYAPRGKRSLEEARAAAGSDALLVLSPTASLLVLYGRTHRWSPGMGALRVRRLRAFRAGRAVEPGARDPFLDACGLRPGECVLDATLGLGADALVAAEAVGPGGRVVGLEASPALAAWVAEGLLRLGDPAASRIEIRTGDHRAVLPDLPDRSHDVVVFDPMFRSARPGPGGLDLLRRLADPSPLSRAALDQARRVARRCVVVKDGAPGWDLARLGLAPLPSARGAHRYFARLPALEGPSVPSR